VLLHLLLERVLQRVHCLRLSQRAQQEVYVGQNDPDVVCDGVIPRRPLCQRSVAIVQSATRVRSVKSKQPTRRGTLLTHPTNCMYRTRRAAFMRFNSVLGSASGSYTRGACSSSGGGVVWQKARGCVHELRVTTQRRSMTSVYAHGAQLQMQCTCLRHQAALGVAASERPVLPDSARQRRRAWARRIYMQVVAAATWTWTPWY